MASIDRSIVVAAPLAQAFDLWAHVEGWPLFLKALRDVRRIDEKKMFHFKSEREGIESEAEISLLIPEQRVAWRTLSGVESAGVVCLESLPDGQTQVSLKMIYAPDVGWHHPDALGRRLEFHLACFKEFIEQRPDR